MEDNFILSFFLLKLSSVFREKLKARTSLTSNEGLDLIISLIITHIRSTHLVCHDFYSKEKGNCHATK